MHTFLSPRIFCVHLLDAQTFLSIIQQMLFNQNPWLSSWFSGWDREPVRGLGGSASVSSGFICPRRTAAWCSHTYQSGFPTHLHLKKLSLRWTFRDDSQTMSYHFWHLEKCMIGPGSFTTGTWVTAKILALTWTQNTKKSSRKPEFSHKYLEKLLGILCKCVFKCNSHTPALKLVLLLFIFCGKSEF